MAISIKEYLERGPSTSKEIQAAAGLSQSSVVRYLKNMGDSVVQLRKGRSVRYAATGNAFGSGDKLPLNLLDAKGDVRLVGYLRPLIHGGFFVEPIGDIPRFLLGDSQDGVYDDLPFFLYDLRPQGFIGRQIARRLASQTGDFPENPKHWTANHIGRYLVANGDDLPGNLIFGEQSLLRVRRSPAAVTEADYPELADRVMGGEVPGSSAGGEQPKFTAYNGALEAHVIVKFSPKGGNDVAERWRDILITEHHAARLLSDRIFPAAKSRLLERGGRLFLETGRMDRHRTFGRRSMISLEAVDAEFTGAGSTWPQVMTDLLDRDLVSRADVQSTAAIWLFGRLIHNSDMHLGNLSLSAEEGRFKLLPVYDMCSMGFAPKSPGEVLPFGFEAADTGFGQLPGFPRQLIGEQFFEDVKSAAFDFWEEVAADGRISENFRRFLGGGNPVG